MSRRNRLVPRLFRARVGENDNQPLDLAPATKMDHVASVATDLCMPGRHGSSGFVTQFGNETGSVER